MSDDDLANSAVSEPKAEDKSAYKEVRGLTRGLEVLRALNRRARIHSTVSEISEVTNLHRTTVKRLLETLRHNGYVEFDSDVSGYRLRHLVQELASGFVDDEWFIECARPVLYDLNDEWIWPLSLSTFDLNSMLVRATTHFRRPIIDGRTSVGGRIPILFTAAGKAYLAACSPARRDQIIWALAQKDGPEGLLARQKSKVSEMISKTQELGYGINQGEWVMNVNHVAISIAIEMDGRPLGSLSSIFHKKAINSNDIPNHALPFLISARDAIVKRLEENPI